MSQTKKRKKELGNSSSQSFSPSSLKREKGKKRKNEHGLPNTASHKLQGEKEKRMV